MYLFFFRTTLLLMLWKLITPLMIHWLLSSSLMAQAPTDEWRRNGIDPMVAEPGQASSILSNPAGLKTKEQRKKQNAALNARSLKQEYITEIIAANFSISFNILDWLTNQEQLNKIATEQLGALSSASELLSGEVKTPDAMLKLLQNLSAENYQKITKGTTYLSKKNPGTLTVNDIQKEGTPGAGGNIGAVQQNLKSADKLVNALADSLGKTIIKDFGRLGLIHYSRLFGLSYSDDSRVISWGIYFGFEQVLAARLNVENSQFPLKLAVNNISLETSLPIGLKLYLLTPLRFAFATDFSEALPGFTFGLGLKVVPYNGFNHYSLSQKFSDQLGADGFDFNPQLLIDTFYGSSGINLGIDAGVQYHFGAITPKLNFLHAGLKISDLLGFNIPLNPGTDLLRYALDFDFGLYAEQTLGQSSPASNSKTKIQLFGGAELIQIRGMLLDSSPFSALYEPLDHLRLLFGIALLDNIIRVSAQYYHNNFGLATMLNFQKFQFSLGISINTLQEKTWGAELSIRFRSPHDGFNKQNQYRKYTNRKYTSRKLRS